MQNQMRPFKEDLNMEIKRNFTLPLGINKLGSFG
jgi:hypothetical protein